MGSPPLIDGYSYVKLLGTGGYSDVYLYHQQLPNRFVAIKVLRTDALSEALRRQFTAEANLMARVSSHAAIGTIYAAGVDAGEQPYLVMEYCSGGSLGARFRHAPLDVADVLHIGVRVASALESAHRAGVVHRDVKPANVLINDYGAAVLTDFGISAIADGFPEATRMREQAYATQSTVDNNASSLGMSIPWAAPETFDDEPRVDVRSDVFSLAATLFSLLEGRSPFEIPGGSNRGAQLIARIQNGSITPMQRPDLPPALVEALMIGLNHNPAYRYPTALAFAERLQQLERELGLAPTRIEVPTVPAAAQTSGQQLTPHSGQQPVQHSAPQQAGSFPTTTTPPAQDQALIATVTPRPAVQSPPRRRKRMAWIIGGVVAGAAVIALVLTLGIPFIGQLTAASAPTPTPTADESQNLVVDELDVEWRNDSWNFTIPEDLAPPSQLEARILKKGDSSTTITAESKVFFGYDVSTWDFGWDLRFTPGTNEGFDTVTVTGRQLEKFMGIDMIGMPVGTVVLVAAPQGYFAQHSPIGDATMRTQIAVIRINALT